MLSVWTQSHGCTTWWAVCKRDFNPICPLCSELRTQCTRQPCVLRWNRNAVEKYWFSGGGGSSILGSWNWENCDTQRWTVQDIVGHLSLVSGKCMWKSLLSEMCHVDAGSRYRLPDWDINPKPRNELRKTLEPLGKSKFSLGTLPHLGTGDSLEIIPMKMSFWEKKLQTTTGPTTRKSQKVNLKPVNMINHG